MESEQDCEELTRAATLTTTQEVVIHDRGQPLAQHVQTAQCFMSPVCSSSGTSPSNPSLPACAPSCGPSCRGAFSSRPRGRPPSCTARRTSRGRPARMPAADKLRHLNHRDRSQRHQQRQGTVSGRQRADLENGPRGRDVMDPELHHDREQNDAKQPQIGERTHFPEHPCGAPRSKGSE